ncbi:MAG TPA: division/cell wall cluster transcriptional repressor MraZ [Nitrospirae bacterium]|nr:division/cell wall cluster transcriptional repressor MraZ [Nitrospirota bacterium]
MASFTGTYYYTLDPKGRIIIPAPIREVLHSEYNNSKIFVTNAPFDKCLNVYPLAQWSILEEKIRGKPKTDKYIQFFIRRVFASAVECDIDKNGRLMIPYELRQNAQLNGDIAIVGGFHIFEIWNKELFVDVTDPEKIDKDACMKALSEYGL